MTKPLSPANLPQTGFISASTLAKALEVSPCTVWRWSKPGGKLPQPHKLSEGTTRWNLGEVHAALTKLVGV